MKEKEIIIDPCYVIGTALLFVNTVDRKILNRVQIRLSDDYELDLKPEKVSLSVDEWKDFFRYDDNRNIILTREGQLNRNMVRFLFAEGLEPEIYYKLVDAILNVPVKQKGKTKILKFPKI